MAGFSHWRVLFWTVLFSESFPLPEEYEVGKSEQKLIKGFKKDVDFLFPLVFFLFPMLFFVCLIVVKYSYAKNSPEQCVSVASGNIFLVSHVVFFLCANKYTMKTLSWQRTFIGLLNNKLLVFIILLISQCSYSHVTEV